MYRCLEPILLPTKQYLFACRWQLRRVFLNPRNLCRFDLSDHAPDRSALSVGEASALICGLFHHHSYDGLLIFHQQTVDIG